MLFSTYLPNIEIVCKDSQDIFQDREVLGETFLSIYISVLNALTNSRLRFLKTLVMPPPNAPKSQMVAYLGCALLMKDRLENLMLADNFESHLPSSEQLFFNHFLSRLNQFDKLVEIHIRRNTNEPIQFLEDIVENCPSLKHLEFHFPCNEKDPSRTKYNASANAVSKYTPRFNMETITTDTVEMVEGGTLPYIAHKFPRLQKLSLASAWDGNVDTKGTDLDRLLPYLSKLNDFSATGFSVDSNTITEAMARFWDTTAAPGSVDVSLIYSEFGESLNLEKQSTIICYPVEDPERKHVDFIEKNGKFIKKADIGFSMYEINDKTERCILPDKFIYHTFEHCPHIQQLGLMECILKKFTVNPNHKYSLDNLDLINCKIHNGALESLSAVLVEVKKVVVANLTYIDDDNENDTSSASLMIKMPHTKINVVSLGRSRNTRQIKTFSAADKKYRYYLLDGYKIYPTDSTEEEYMHADNHTRVEIWCQGTPIVKNWTQSDS
ncbi:unnamed protein product [Mucor hiemalis]